MKQKIKIGLTFTGTDEKHENYVNWLKADENISVVKLSVEANNLDAVREIDALVLSGGIDAHPSSYGSKVVSYPNAPDPFFPERDAFETALFNESQRLELPVLGICRGMQLINCILGGDLKQDLGELTNDLHRNTGTDKKHVLQVFPGTFLSEITGIKLEPVNSAHHQAVHSLGKGLTVNAASEDGVPEGIEWADRKGKPYLLGVQWHPERMHKLGMQESPLSKKIRDHFINTVRQTANNDK